MENNNCALRKTNLQIFLSLQFPWAILSASCVGHFKIKQNNSRCIASEYDQFRKIRLFITRDQIYYFSSREKWYGNCKVYAFIIASVFLALTMECISIFSSFVIIICKFKKFYNALVLCKCIFQFLLCIFFFPLSTPHRIVINERIQANVIKALNFI